FIDPKLAPGYIAWIASDGETAHVGVAGYRARFDPSKALAEFRRRVRRIVGGRAIERRGGLIPVNGILRTIGNDRGLLVGDPAAAHSPTCTPAARKPPMMWSSSWLMYSREPLSTTTGGVQLYLPFVKLIFSERRPRAANGRIKPPIVIASGHPEIFPPCPCTIGSSMK